MAAIPSNSSPCTPAVASSVLPAAAPRTTSTGSSMGEPSARGTTSRTNDFLAPGLKSCQRGCKSVMMNYSGQGERGYVARGIALEPALPSLVYSLDRLPRNQTAVRSDQADSKNEGGHV